MAYSNRLAAIERQLKKQPVQLVEDNPFSPFSDEEFSCALTWLRWMVEPTESAQPAKDDALGLVSRLHELVKGLEPEARKALAEVQNVEQEWRSHGYFDKNNLLERCTTKEETFEILFGAVLERIQDEKTKA